MSPLNEKEGILPAKIISENIIKSIKVIFSDIFSENDSALYSWGSLARREMCIFSDIDIIVIHKSGRIKTKVTRFINKVSLQFPHNKIDLLQKFNVSELIEIARIDGGDRQALTMARLETNKNLVSSRFQKDILIKLNSKNEKIRELLYIMVNLKKVYPVLFPHNDLKFGQYGLRYLNCAVLFAKYFVDEENCAYDTRAALKALLQKSIISNDLYYKSINALNYFLFLRNQVQINKNSEFNVLENYKSEDNAKNVTNDNDFPDLNLKKHKRNVKLLIDILFSKTMQLAKKELGEEVCELINELLGDHSDKVEAAALKLNSEIVIMILSYCTKDPLVTDFLYETNKSNWYILFGIANNPYSDSSTLFKLVNPKNKSKRLKSLYNDFAWRNIYLYVARNPAADKETLNFIIRHGNCRKMDIDAAKNNLLKRSMI